MSRFTGRQRFLLGLLVPVLIGALLYYAVFAPLVQKYHEARSELATRDARLQQMQATLAQLPELRSRRDELVVAMKELLRAIPAEAATDELLAQMSGFASAAQARLLSLSVGEMAPPREEKGSRNQSGSGTGSPAPGSPPPGGAACTGVAPRPYLELPVEMTFLGPYPAIQQVLFDLRSWGRLVILSRLEIASDDQPTPSLTARLQGLAFSYAREEGSAGGNR